MKMNIGTKIGGGFAAVILLMLLLGGMSIFNMKEAQSESKMLDEEYMPEVEIASAIERNALLTMFAMRGFALSERQQYYAEGSQKLAEVEKDLTGAMDLAQRSEHLVELKASVESLSAKVKEYRSVSTERAAIIEQMGLARTALDAAAKQYMDNCNQYIADQNEKMKEDARSGAAKVLDRNWKLELANDIVDLGNAVQLAVWRAQAERTPEQIEQALQSFPQIERKLDEIEAKTSQEANLRQLEITRQAAHEYQAAMVQLSGNYQKLTALTTKAEEVSAGVLEGSQAVALAGIGEARTIASDTENTLSASTVVMVIGLLVALALGAVLAVTITRMISRPVVEIAAVAEAIALGDLNRQVTIVQADEVGQLAESFRRMGKMLQEKEQAAEEIAKGNLQVKVAVASEQDSLGKAMVRMIESLTRMNQEVQGLTRAALAGQLDTRAEAGKHQGDYGKLIGGINELLEAIVAPIQEGARVLETAAGKDLTRRVEGNYQGQLADLKNNINATIEALDSALSQVSEAVEQVSSASNQISSGSQSLAQGANEQASSLEEVSSSLEEMSSMTRQNADNATQAKTLALSARDSAKKGNQAMGRMAEAIGKIKASSRPDGEDRQDDRRDRLPDQPAGAQRRGRGGAGRRGRQGLRGGGRGGPQPGPAQRRGGAQHRRHDRGERQERRGRGADHRGSGRFLRRDCRGGQQGQRPGGGDRRGGAGAGPGDRAGQHGGQPDGHGDPAERLQQRGIGQRGRGAQ